VILISDLLTRLQGVKQTGNNKWLARCPCGNRHAHNDRERSLSVTFDSGSGKILMNCFTGCTFYDICGALSIAPGDLMPELAADEKRRQFLQWYAGEHGLKLEAVYSYDYGTFKDGVCKIRFRQQSDGKKTFRWIHADDSKKSGVAFGRGDNPNRLYVRGDIVDALCFIVEGEKDADTLYGLMGITTVCTENGASTSTGGGKWRQEYTQQLEGKVVYILWDNDDVGRAFADLEAAELQEHVEAIYMLDISQAWAECPDKGDISDMVKALGAEETIERINDLVANTPERQQVPRETEHFNSAAMDFNDWIEYDGYEAPAAPQEAQEQPQALPAEQAQGEALTAPQEAPRKPQRVDAFTSFMEKIQTEAYRPVRTGMGAFDRLLYGGIPRQSLIMLTAAPGAGKTTFCQQVFETAAALGTDVLFINLEMSREQLYSRSLSRLIHIQGGNMNAMQVMRGYKWTDEQRAYVESAAAAYQEKINPFMHYNPVEGTSDIELIMACLEKAASWCKKKGRNPPVAVIDYLHLITGKDDKGRDMDSATVIKLAVKRLKDWAVQNDSYVFAIGANNRAANSKGTITLESGRDSSAIEYSADIQLSLNYRALHEKRKINVRHYNEDTGEYEEKEVKATPENPDVMEALQTMEERDMILQTLKSRMIPARGKLYLRFNAGSSTFTPIVNPYDGDDFVEIEDSENPWADEIEESDDYE